MRWSLLSFVCTALLIAIVARPTRSADAPPTATVKIVSSSGYAFDPAVLEVKVGTVVTWTNTEDGAHDIRSGTPDAPKDGPIKGSLPKKGASFSVTFDKPGEYSYFCDFHHRMKGKVVVK